MIPPKGSVREENRAHYPIAVMCRVLGVSPSGYYAWAKRPASERAVMDAALIVTMRGDAVSTCRHGAPRLEVDLADAGIRVSRKRVARLMLKRRPGRREPSQTHRHDRQGGGASGARSRRPRLHG